MLATGRLPAPGSQPREPVQMAAQAASEPPRHPPGGSCLRPSPSRRSGFDSGVGKVRAVAKHLFFKKRKCGFIIKATQLGLTSSGWQYTAHVASRKSLRRRMKKTK